MLTIEKYIKTETLVLVRHQGAKVQSFSMGDWDILELMVVMVVQLCDDTKAVKLYILNE